MPPPGRRPTADLRSADSAFAAVAAALWAERDLLDVLHYRLATARALLAVGAARWLNRIDDDVRGALLRLRAQEAARSTEVARLTAALRLPADAALSDIVAKAPAAWALVLRETGEELGDLLSEVDSGLAEVRRLLTAGAASARRSLEQLPSGAEPGEAAESADLTTSQFALQLATTSASYEAALRTAGSVSAQSLRRLLS